jgi:catechol-2,3-dioxygenase
MTTASPVRPLRLAHVVRETRDLIAMRDWYSVVLDARVVFENETVCFMTYDDEHHRIGFVKLPDAAPRSLAAGAEHTGYSCLDLGTLLSTYRRLKEAKIEPYWTINHGPTMSFYYRDPDGNRLELFVDNFDSPEEAHAFFVDGRYEENSMGILVDPETLARRYEEGTPLAELLRRPELPPGKTAWDMFRP